MKALLQRVSHASVSVDGQIVSEIGAGYLILLGVARGDGEEDARILSEKISKFRIFADENGRMNRSVLDIGGEILCVSQFTLCANYAHGNRPDFLSAESPERANALYEYFCASLSEKGIVVKQGIFGADMKVSLLNDGPVTVMLDGDILRKRK